MDDTTNSSSSKKKVREEAMVVCASPNGKHLAVGYQNGMIKIFSLTDNETTVNFHGHKSTITTLVFTQDSATLFSGSKVRRRKKRMIREGFCRIRILSHGISLPKLVSIVFEVIKHR